MIEWKKWNGEMLPKKQYLIYVQGEVKVAKPYWYRPGGPEEGCPAWEVGGGRLFFQNVSYYAEINLPEGE